MNGKKETDAEEIQEMKCVNYVNWTGLTLKIKTIEGKNM